MHFSDAECWPCDIIRHYFWASTQKPFMFIFLTKINLSHYLFFCFCMLMLYGMFWSIKYGSPFSPSRLLPCMFRTVCSLLINLVEMELHAKGCRTYFWFNTNRIFDRGYLWRNCPYPMFMSLVFWLIILWLLLYLFCYQIY